MADLGRWDAWDPTPDRRPGVERPDLYNRPWSTSHLMRQLNAVYPPAAHASCFPQCVARCLLRRTWMRTRSDVGCGCRDLNDASRLRPVHHDRDPAKCPGTADRLGATSDGLIIRRLTGCENAQTPSAQHCRRSGTRGSQSPCATVAETVAVGETIGGLLPQV